MAESSPNDQFLGTRRFDGVDEKGHKKFGPYEWKTYAETRTIAENLARGLQVTDHLCTTEGEGKHWRFLGIWAKNRWEWTVTLLGSMYVKGTVVGFYDAMSAEAVDFILNQTQMETLLVAGEYVAKIMKMRKDGLAK